MRHPNDVRQIRGERDDEALDCLRARRDAWVDEELRLARLLHRIDRKGAFLFAGAASLRELAERCGYDPDRADELLLLGYALAGEPELEDALRERRVRWVAARALGRIHRDPRLLAAGDDWLELASSLGIRDLRHRIRERVESVRQQANAVVAFAAAITEETKEDLATSRRLASQKAKQRLTNGQLLKVLATTYNDLFDPARTTPRKRRMPDTATLPTERGVAAEVVRAILARSGGICEFGGCERDGAELCHLTPHVDGSAREVRDLVHGCHRHHSLYDDGAIRFLGWADDGGPSFIVAATHEILLPKPPPEDRETPPRPAWLVRATRRPKRRQPEKERPTGLADVRDDIDGAGTVRETAPAYAASGCATATGPPAPTSRDPGSQATGPPGKASAASRMVRSSRSGRRRPDARAPRASAPSSRPRSRRSP